VTPRYRAPRHPVVLCHGLFGFDKVGPAALPSLQIHYWRGIQEALHVNLIAHSMGGLDGRHLITHLRPETYRVRSLTTISTPHRGSPFMDWCRDHLGLAAVGASEAKPDASQPAVTTRTLSVDSPSPSSSSSSSLAPTLTAAAHQLQPVLQHLRPLLDHPAYANLTTTYLQRQFNPSTPNHSGVQYFSYGARAPPLSLVHMLRLPWEVVTAREGDNDGLVSVESARWGQYLGTVEADHWELNNR
ncbi:Alpha/Beta hydrolase protein, partial [Thamnocephalis sphaerospora]